MKNLLILLLLGLLHVTICKGINTVSVEIENAEPFSNLVHGWGNVGEMLAANFGTTNEDRYNFTTEGEAVWQFMAKTYRAIALNTFLEPWTNSSVESGRAKAARKLKSINPDVKILFYYSSSATGKNPATQAQLNAHPEWWWRDDYGNPILDHGMHFVDYRNAGLREWFKNLPASEVQPHSDVFKYVDGVFLDSNEYGPRKNISIANYNSYFDAKLKFENEFHEMFRKANGGELWANGLYNYNAYGKPLEPGQYNGTNWNLTLAHYGGAFDEMWGVFDLLNKDGTWKTDNMDFTLRSALEAGTAGHSVIVKASPGPATVPFTEFGIPGHHFSAPSWAGSTPRPTTLAGLKKAAQDVLVQALAPFLIVATEHSWFSYAWFYSADSGYVPCPDEPAICGVENDFYPDFNKPLGPPKGPPVQNGHVWTREFEHAKVYVDTADREACKITWE